MTRNTIIVLIYHHHKPLDLILAECLSQIFSVKETH
jgi:hypothetical protein